MSEWEVRPSIHQNLLAYRFPFTPEIECTHLAGGLSYGGLVNSTWASLLLSMGSVKEMKCHLAQPFKKDEKILFSSPPGFLTPSGFL